MCLYYKERETGSFLSKSAETRFLSKQFKILNGRGARVDRNSLRKKNRVVIVKTEIRSENLKEEMF